MGLFHGLVRGKGNGSGELSWVGRKDSTLVEEGPDSDWECAFGHMRLKGVFA